MHPHPEGRQPDASRGDLSVVRKAPVKAVVRKAPLKAGHSKAPLKAGIP